MSRKANTKLIGAFVLGAVVLVIVVFVVFGSGEFFAVKEYYVIYFKGDVNGLRPKAPVKMRGVEMGTVDDLRGLMDEQGNMYIEVIIKADRRAFHYIGPTDAPFASFTQEELVAFMVDRGLKAQLATQSLVTGQLYVKIDYFPDIPVEFVGLNNEWKDLEIPTAPTTGEELRRTLDNALHTFDQLKLVEITEAALATLQNVDSLIRSPQWQDAIATLTETLDETQRALAVFQEEIRPMSQNFAAAADQARVTLERTEGLMAQLERTAATDRYDLKVALKEFTEANRALRNLMDFIQREPSSVVWGKD